MNCLSKQILAFFCFFLSSYPRFYTSIATDNCSSLRASSKARLESFRCKFSANRFDKAREGRLCHPNNSDPEKFDRNVVFEGYSQAALHWKEKQTDVHTGAEFSFSPERETRNLLQLQQSSGSHEANDPKRFFRSRKHKGGHLKGSKDFAVLSKN